MERKRENEKILTLTYLKSILAYDSETGEFTWLVNKGMRARAGARAGGVNKINGYRNLGIDGVLYQEHRLAYFHETGTFPEFEIDHINHICSDNRYINLRAVNRLENMRNVSQYKNNTSGYTGVRWNKASEKWVARIRVEGRDIHLGLFTDLLDALRARSQADIRYDFHKNHGQDKALLNPSSI